MAVVNLQFDVLVPKQSHQEGFEQDRKAGGVKEKVFKGALRDLDASAFIIVLPGAGPGTPDTPLDETKTLEELGIADGMRLVIKPQ